MRPALRPDIREGWLRFVGGLVGLKPIEVAHMTLAEVLRVADYRCKDVSRTR